MRQCRSWAISRRPMILTMSDHWLLITVWIQRTINYCLSVLDNARLCAKSDSLLGQNVHPRPSRHNLEQSRRHRPAWRYDVHLKHYRPLFILAHIERYNWIKHNVVCWNLASSGLFWYLNVYMFYLRAGHFYKYLCAYFPVAHGRKWSIHVNFAML